MSILTKLFSRLRPASVPPMRRRISFRLLANQLAITCGVTTSFGISWTPYGSERIKKLWPTVPSWPLSARLPTSFVHLQVRVAGICDLNAFRYVRKWAFLEVRLENAQKHGSEHVTLATLRDQLALGRGLQPRARVLHEHRWRVRVTALRCIARPPD